MSSSEWLPHAEKEFGRFTHAVSKDMPEKMTRLRRIGVTIRSVTATTTNRKTR